MMLMTMYILIITEADVFIHIFREFMELEKRITRAETGKKTHGEEEKRSQRFVGR